MLLKDLKIITNKKQQNSFWLIQLLITISAIFEVLSIFAVLPFISFVMGVDTINSDKYFKIYNFFFKDANTDNIVYFSGITAIILFVMSTLLAFSVNTITIYFSNKTAATITNNLYKKYLNKEWLFHVLNPGDKLISRLANDASKINRIFIDIFAINFNSIKTLFIIVSIFLYNFKIAIILTIVFIFGYTFLYFFLKTKLYNVGELLSTDQRNLQKRMTESFGAIREIIISKNQNFFSDYFSEDRNKISQRESFALSASFLPRFVIESIGITASLILIIYYYSYYGGISEVIVTLAIFTFASFKLIPSFQSIFSSLAQIKAYSASFDKIKNDLMSFEYDIKLKDISKHQNLNLENIKNLELKDVSFSYPNANLPSVEFLELKIPMKSKIAIAGESGSGKTTLINILTGLVKLKKGDIFVDTKKLNKELFQEFQNKIGLVPQNIFLFDDTILNNILVGQANDKIDIKNIEKVLKICDLDQLISTLPNGVNTRIGEKGVNLSGGQKQKIGIARCIYLNKEIIIFDEATSSMDAISENKIINNIIENDQNKTIVLISHNYSTFKNFDHIVFFENGKINEIGTYDNLIKNNLKFRNLANEKKNNE
jgi:ABC-type multidrug transport system fused ATPase/permease subunit